jgi:hypothetical protein
MLKGKVELEGSRNLDLQNGYILQEDKTRSL